MRTILTILKSPLIWRIMISLTVFLLLRELKAIHKDIGRMGSNQSLSHRQPEILQQHGLMELVSDLSEKNREVCLKPGNVRAVSTMSFEQQEQGITGLRDSIAWVPQQDGTGSIHYSHTINIER